MINKLKYKEKVEVEKEIDFPFFSKHMHNPCGVYTVLYFDHMYISNYIVSGTWWEIKYIDNLARISDALERGEILSLEGEELLKAQEHHKNTREKIRGVIEND